ncbi:LytR C-terminal domain-containing protein [Actinotalea sp. C106]|uniref:LytR C-terminal domain-containing protein n=1 Tax=Actinotalea sp. C106 TaxID=2908644 RepID=UPI0020293FE5|nr:LytR C-terminal domain-containing protein [Actinotalea sp. C106]
MRSGDYPYPADDFDQVSTVGPRGAHRAPRSRWSRWWPFAVVLVVLPVLAFGLVTWLSDWRGLTGTDDPVITAPVDPEEEAAEEPEEGAPAETEEPAEPEEPAEEPEPEPEPEPDLTRPVEVFNATSITGLAGGAAERLETAGFVDVAAGNWTGASPEASSVLYGSEEDLATAQAAADALGIGVVEISAEAADGIVVVLGGDYQA